MSLLLLTHDVVMVRDDSSTFVGRLFVSRLQAHVLRLLSLRCRFAQDLVLVSTVLGLTIYASTSFLPRLPHLQSKPTSI